MREYFKHKATFTKKGFHIKIDKTALGECVAAQKKERMWSYEKNPPHDGSGSARRAAAVIGWVRFL